jgi:hypothetical protein
VLRHGRASAYRERFRLDFERGPDGFAYQTFEGHRQMVALNHRSEAVLEWATDVALYWLARTIGSVEGRVTETDTFGRGPPTAVNPRRDLLTRATRGSAVKP